MLDHMLDHMIISIVTTALYIFKAIFCEDEAKKIHIAWYNNGLAKVITTEDWNNVKGQIAKQPNSKINGNFF